MHARRRTRQVPRGGGTILFTTTQTIVGGGVDGIRCGRRDSLKVSASPHKAKRPHQKGEGKIIDLELYERLCLRSVSVEYHGREYRRGRLLVLDFGAGPARRDDDATVDFVR